MIAIGTLRRRLFVNHSDEWNGIVREVTADFEEPGGVVDFWIVRKHLAAIYRARATEFRGRRYDDEI